MSYEFVEETGDEKAVEKPVPAGETGSKPQPASQAASQPTPVSQGGNLRNTVYLTFDDGPGVHTARLLDILKKYNARASFFVTCAGDDSLIKREYDEGHTVALHACLHDYARVYASEEAFFSDLYAIKARVKRITGCDVTMMRFPGGSSNTVSARYNRGIMTRLTKEVQDRGFVYFDWNVPSGDTDGTTSSDEVYRNVIAGMGVYEDGAVVLQHDVKDYSVDAVERILQYGQEHGFVFERLTPVSCTAHHFVRN